jgi:hypothetical protein
MPEWLITSTTSEAPATVAEFALRLLVALLFGGGVAAIYRLSHGRENSRAATLATTLVLLSVLIAMVSIVIGNSVARAFSLVGALSIVRFRTVVEDTRDTAFVIFAVIVGMAAGAGQLLVPVVGLPIVGAAAIALSRWTEPNGAALVAESLLTVRLAVGRDPETLLSVILAQHFESTEIEAAATARQGAALDFTYRGRLKPTGSPTALVMELNQIEGVMNVELRKA